MAVTRPGTPQVPQPELVLPSMISGGSLYSYKNSANQKKHTLENGPQP
jgi:hypothetical protein